VAALASTPPSGSWKRHGYVELDKGHWLAGRSRERWLGPLDRRRDAILLRGKCRGGVGRGGSGEKRRECNHRAGEIHRHLPPGGCAHIGQWANSIADLPPSRRPQKTSEIDPQDTGPYRRYRNPGV